MVIDLETMNELADRMALEPLRVLGLCAGMSGSYDILIEMGYTIGVWGAVGTARKAYLQLNHAGDANICGKWEMTLGVGGTTLSAMEQSR